MNDIKLEKEDYTDPACPFCTDQYKNEPPVRAVPVGRIIQKLDEHLSYNDYDSGEKLLLYWLREAENGHDKRGKLTICNELMGLYRKTGKKEKALKSLETALFLVEETGIEDTVTAGTTFVNAATVYKAFGSPEKSLPVFRKAQTIYEKELKENDERLGGLYNNMALTLADLEKYDEAYKYYDKAISVMMKNKNGELEAAITYLNIANALENEKGLENAESEIAKLIEKAYSLLDTEGIPRDGYYAFVCEKCAPTFGYYGYFLYNNELKERARKIYERA